MKWFVDFPINTSIARKKPIKPIVSVSAEMKTSKSIFPQYSFKLYEMSK